MAVAKVGMQQGVFLVGEFRGGSWESGSWNNPQSGRNEPFKNYKAVVEVLEPDGKVRAVTLSIGERGEVDEKTLRKGFPCIAHLTKYEVAKGNHSAKGDRLVGLEGA